MTKKAQSINPHPVDGVRSLINGFIDERLKAKLDSLKDGDDDKRKKLLQDYSRENWLENAAKRVSQIQLVTHALKYTHADARGSSIHHVPVESQSGPWVVSANESLVDDVVGNAAALDVFKFLKLEIGGQTLLQRAKAGDNSLKAAFCEDKERAERWCEAFAGITQEVGQPASHTLAKQVYFPLRDGGYHLLAPLYPTALVHRFFTQIQKYRFSDEIKVARAARRKGLAHPTGYREYLNLAVCKFGGSKPQNISQLNSERGGKGYLLPSFPPHWQQRPIKPPLHVKTVFGAWLNWGDLRSLSWQLRVYLERLPKDRTNIQIRDGRARRVNGIVDALLNRVAAVQQLSGGWSAVPGCRLDSAETYWLDPKRARIDEVFAERRRAGDWPAQISQRFASWLNARIRSDRLRVGDPEHFEWKHQLDDALSWLTEELDDER